MNESCGHMTSRPIGLSRDLPPKRVMRAAVDGCDVVVWRAADGTIAAWNNRCPHRGMALSHGFVRGNTLACLYHGWHYKTSGVCSYIPAHPDLKPPATIQATQYGVAEAGGVIWVSVAGEADGEDLHLAPLRSMIISAPDAAVQSACRAVPLEGVLPEVTANRLCRFGEETLSILSNPLASGTQVTILATPGLPAARYRTLSRWCEALRRAAERDGDT